MTAGCLCANYCGERGIIDSGFAAEGKTIPELVGGRAGWGYAGSCK